jgi:hypothetical protein
MRVRRTIGNLATVIGLMCATSSLYAADLTCPPDQYLIPVVGPAKAFIELVTGAGACGPVVGTGRPSRPVLECTAPQLNGLPQFDQPPPRSAVYTFSGTCTVADRPGQLTYRVTGTWTPSETSDDRANASEVTEITGYEAFLRDRAPEGRIYMTFSARCNKDPWLYGDIANCRPFGAYIPDDLAHAVPGLATQYLFPSTRDIIPPSDRRRLLAEYRRVNGILPGLTPETGIRQNAARMDVQTPRSQAVPAARAAPGIAQSVPPALVEPARGAQAPLGQLRLRIEPPGRGSTEAEVAFKWLSHPMGVVQLFTWQVPIDQLVAGVIVPASATEGHIGYWEVQVRVAAPFESQWSPKVWIELTSPPPATKLRPRAIVR